jgi:hypothetical protein
MLRHEGAFAIGVFDDLGASVDAPACRRDLDRRLPGDVPDPVGAVTVGRPLFRPRVVSRTQPGARSK